MKLLVTGATGGIGSWIVEDLAAAGHEVVGVDRDRPPGRRENVHFYAADLTDQGQTWELVQTEAPEAIVHTASIPVMGQRPGTATFTNNVEVTYNTFLAAGTVGADVVFTSSESLYGMPFADPPFLPDYLPIDEAHPMRPKDAYGTSKLVSEELAEMIVRRDGIAVTSIRPSWVQYPGEYECREVAAAFDADAPERSGNFWSYIDVRDVVSMVRAAVDAETTGHEAYLAVADENYLGVPTTEAIEAAFGDVPDECALTGEQSAFTTAKASRDLDWSPAHDWRAAAEESVEGPSFL